MKIYKFQPKFNKTHNDQNKKISGWGYWGDPNEIKLAISKGQINYDNYIPEKRHAHSDSYVYFIVLTGKGLVNVNNTDINVGKDDVLEIAPKEIYFVRKALKTPFDWLVIGTITGNKDKIVYDN